MGAPRPRLAAKQALGGVRKCLDSLSLQPDDLVLVACSGGADSLALAAVAKTVAHYVGKTTRKKGFAIRVGAVIVDHQLQAGSAAAAAQAEAQCRILGLDPIAVVAAKPHAEGGPEAGARTARYQAIEQVAERLGAKAVLLGHTLDDQAEQVLLGLARGSGLRSLAGMPYQRRLYLRPFLQVKRNTTEALCQWYGLEPWHDPTNQQPIYLRNRIRLTALPALTEAIGPGVPEALARTAEQLAEDADALDFYAKQLLVAAGDRSSAGGEVQGLDVEVLLGAPTAVRRRALRLAAIQAGAPASDVNRTQVLAIDALVANWHGQSAHTLPGSIIVRRDCGRLWFAPSQNQGGADGTKGLAGGIS